MPSYWDKLRLATSPFEQFLTTGEKSSQKLAEEETQAHEDVQFIRANLVRFLTVTFLNDQGAPTYGAEIDHHLASEGKCDATENRTARLELASAGILKRYEGKWVFTPQGLNTLHILFSPEAQRG